jgi:hypothetical protein
MLSKIVSGIERLELQYKKLGWQAADNAVIVGTGLSAPPGPSGPSGPRADKAGIQTIGNDQHMAFPFCDCDLAY